MTLQVKIGMRVCKRNSSAGTPRSVKKQGEEVFKVTELRFPWSLQ